MKWAPGCELYEPATPEGWGSIRSLKWKTCISGRAGCEQLERDWTEWKDTWVYRIYAADHAGHAFLTLGRSYAEDSPPYRQPPERTEWLVLRDETVVAAWRIVGTCLSALRGIASPSRVMAVARREDASGPLTEYGFLAGDVTKPETLMGASTALHFSDVQLGGQGLLALAEEASPDVLAIGIDSVSRGVVVDRSQGSVNALSGSIGQMGVVGDVVVFSVWDWGKKSTLEVWTRQGGQNVLVDQGPGIYAHSVATDGARMVWTEGSNMGQDGLFATSVVYESPFSIDPRKVSPTVLLSPGCQGWHCDSRVQAGYAILYTPFGQKSGEQEHSLVRFSDHARWRLRPIKGKEEWQDQPSIAGGKLYVPAIDMTAPPFNRGLERIDIAALGAPETD